MPKDIGLHGANMAIRAAETAVHEGQLLLCALAKPGKGALSASALPGAKRKGFKR
ncbi:MAG: hypothetical protein FWG30_10640 [Eubacteriaceae bacterium]|jgi:hypothetical protein|nr:hypothetical protein [Eubacteriaceae bacterium]